MRGVAIAVLLASVLSLASCGERLLVKGLTLPAGSQEVKFNPDAKSAVPEAAARYRAQIQKAVAVSFNSSSGWDGVSADIDGKMKAQAYTEQMQELAGMGGQVEKLAGGKRGLLGKMIGGAMQQFVHVYTKPGGRYLVVLTNNHPIAAIPQLGDRLPKAAEGGDFMLFVAEYKGD